MPGLAPDHDVEGHFRILLRLFESQMWKGVWENLTVTVESFESLGLTPTSSDREVWHRCQSRQVVLVTGNRNQDGPDSLETTIRTDNKLDSLPVITIADRGRFLASKKYADDVAEEVLRILMDLDECRGAGRLYVP